MSARHTGGQAARLALLAASLLGALAFAVAPAYAGESAGQPAPEPVCPELPCSVKRSCSSTGIACDARDRECTERARSKDLVVLCEQQCDMGPMLVYCPPDTERPESKIVWILLATAVLLAVGGGALLSVVLRKKSA